MATFFRTKVVKGIGTTAVDAVQTVENNRFTIIGCNLANIIDDPVTVDIFVVDSSSTAGYYIKGIILAEQCGLKILSDTDNSIDAVISYAEIV